METTLNRPPSRIAIDFEAAGSRLGRQTTLSIGAVLVPRDRQRSFAEYEAAGHVFYAELKPISPSFDIKAMRVGCLHLECLDALRPTDPRYNPEHEAFDPELVLKLLDRVGEHPKSAIERFRTWINTATDNNPNIIAITDTVIADGGHLNFNFGAFSDEPSPFGWSGLDLDSTYRGYKQRPDASLKELPVPEPVKKHHAAHDAAQLANRANYLLHELMNWE